MILGGFVDSGVISYHTKLDNNRKPIGFLLCCCCVAGLAGAGGNVEQWSCRLLQVPPPSADWQCAARRAVQSAQLGTDRFYRAAPAQTRTLSCDAGPALPASNAHLTQHCWSNTQVCRIIPCWVSPLVHLRHSKASKEHFKVRDN